MSGMDIDAWLDRPVEGGLARRIRMRLGVALGLLFLIGPVSDLVHQSSFGWERAIRVAGLVLFIALYVSVLPPAPWLVRFGPRAPQLAIVALAVIATVLVATGAPRSFTALYVYVVAAAGLVFRPRLAGAITLALACAVGVGLVVVGERASVTASILLTILAIGAMMAAFGRQIHANRELRAAREELARLAVSEERLRIARDLHDLLGHTLSVIALKSELAAKLVERDAAKARAELEEVQAVTRQALAEVREAVHAYRHLALGEALAGARAQLDAAGIRCRLEESDVPLPPEVEAVLAWTVREGATNVVRHSGASSCSIRVRADGETAAVEVEDDGVAAGASGGSGSGLAGLAERAELLRGRVEAGARPEGGFRLRVTVPVGAA
jgi:two-component system sensor histidine kinase DesK